MLYLAQDQVQLFLSAAKSYRLYSRFALAIGTGMRQGELLGLQWPDIDFDQTSARSSSSRNRRRHRASAAIMLPAFCLTAFG
jgi:integrase